MSRILRRPMFRGGGSVNSYGTGIAAPLVPGYQGGGSINTPRRGLVSLPGGYAGEEMSLTEKIAAMFGNINVGTSGGIIPNTKKFTQSTATSDGTTTGGDIVESNVETVIPGVYKPKDKEDSDAYTDFILKKSDILTEAEIDEKVKEGKTLDKRFFRDFGFLDYLRQDISGLTKDLSYDKSDVGKKEYKDELTKINEANKELYKKYDIPYEGQVKGREFVGDEEMIGDPRKPLPDSKVVKSLGDGDPTIKDTEESLSIDPKDAIAQNQALFAELLGADKARGQDIGDMLLRFSGSQGNTLGEKFQNYTRAESAAGPSRSEKIKQTAAGLAINDYVAGKRSAEQIDKLKEVETFRSKLKTDQFTIQEGDSWREGLDKTVLKYGGKEGKSDSVGIIAETIKSFEPGQKVFREDNVNPKKLDIGDLEIGITIITLKNGSKRIIKKIGEGENDFVDLTSKYPV